MNWRPPHVLVSLLIVCVVLVLGGAGVAFYLTHQGTVSISSHPLHVVWEVSTTAFTQEDQRGIEKAVQDAIARQAKDVPRPSEIDIITAQRVGDWATFSTQQKTSSTQELATEPGILIAHKQGSSWSLLLPGTPNFCNRLQQVPDSLLAPIDKSYFCKP